MASVFDIAEFILSETGYVSTMKLQKLVFYSQAYSLAAFNTPLFSNDFEAWVNGPVCPELFQAHKGMFIVGKGDLKSCGDENKVSSNQALILGHILSVLGRFDGKQLSELTHSEKPWLDARAGCVDGERCSNVISKRAIALYYASPACKNAAFADLKR